MRSAGRAKEVDGDSDEEAMLLEDPVVHRLDVRAHHQEYIDSIDFKPGSEVQMNMP